MRNIKLIIQYDGTNYCGWQIQNIKYQKSNTKNKTIQGEIEKVLSKILQEKVKLIASGRTDSGVHAQAQVANFKTNSKISCDKIKNALNGLLPSDIKIIEAKDAVLSFNARASAKSKVYRYLILNSQIPSPFLDRFVCFYHYDLDLALLEKASKKFLGRHDFKAFCASGSSIKNTVREIKKINIKEVKFKLFGNIDGLISIEIEADGFLYNMVRSIVGTLVEVARGKLSIDKIDEIFKHNKRPLIGRTFPAKGLHLVKARY